MADTLDIMTCPACGSEMLKVYIDEKQIYVDVCVNGCGGIFFDNREFKLFDEQHENAKEIFKTLEERTFKPVEETSTRICPACGAKMVKNYSSIKKGIQVDDCYSCGGKFLDNKELNKIREEYINDAERAKDVEAYLYDQIGTELEKNREMGEKARADVTNADRLGMFISWMKNR